MHTGGVLVVLAIAFAGLGACGSRKEGLRPVGGAEATDAQLARYVKRLHLDLTGAAPDAATVEAARARLDGGNNRPGLRAELAAELLAGPAFAEQYVSELVAQVLAGETVETQTALACLIYRNAVPECQACGPVEGDPCVGCDCYFVTETKAEEAGMLAAAADLAAGASTSTADRRFAASTAYRFTFGSVEMAAAGMFDDFMGRPIDPDEQRNAAAMITGAPEFSPTSPAGMLFHRQGSNVDDLVDIVFESEVYREAVVSVVFQRYLGRPATPAETAHFAPLLDPVDPDLRPVIEKVVSSQEYFDL